MPRFAQKCPGFKVSWGTSQEPGHPRGTGRPSGDEREREESKQRGTDTGRAARLALGGGLHGRGSETPNTSMAGAAAGAQDSAPRPEWGAGAEPTSGTRPRLLGPPEGGVGAETQVMQRPQLNRILRASKTLPTKKTSPFMANTPRQKSLKLILPRWLGSKYFTSFSTCGKEGRTGVRPPETPQGIPGAGWREGSSTEPRGCQRCPPSPLCPQPGVSTSLRQQWGRLIFLGSPDCMSAEKQNQHGRAQKTGLSGRASSPSPSHKDWREESQGSDSLT